jgi:Alanine racemase, N-terminal domain
MPLTLTVDGPRWRRHLRQVLDTHPGLVPVAKGNGYGFALSRLARKTQWLGCDLLAVGTYEEVPEVLSRFDGDVLVLSPYRPFLRAVPTDPRVVHTIGRTEDLDALTSLTSRPRVVLEGLTSMRRHGFVEDELARVFDRGGVRVDGLALHLPIGVDVTREVHDWLSLGLHRTVFVSHLSDAQIKALSTRHPDVTLRPRVGTHLWLGERSALRVRATVLDVHAVVRGDRAGYRQRRAPRDGHVVVVAGGTAHGIGLEAPTPASSIRQRAVALARGGLDAAGFALSAYSVAGRQRWFLEPPHMQCSMLFVPASVPPPAIGDELPVDVRFTTTTFDHITVT